MRWRAVIHAEHVGFGAAFEDGSLRNIWACHLECGHSGIVTTRAQPVRLDCMRCGDKPVQLMLPVALPRQDRLKCL